MSAAETAYAPEDLLRPLHVTRGHFALESGYHGDPPGHGRHRRRGTPHGRPWRPEDCPRCLRGEAPTDIA